jgi:PEP-CTERM motif-containing protein
MERVTLAGRVFAVSLVAAALLALGSPPSVQADSCGTSTSTSTVECLSVPNANLATQGAGPYGEFTITALDATGKNWQVVALGLNGFVFGDSSILGLNLSAAAGAGTLTPQAGFSQSAAGNVDGFGTFNFVVNDGPGFSSPLPTFTIDFTTANAVTLANLLTESSPDAVGHLAKSTNTACTGFAADGGTATGTVDNSACTSAVPEPMTLLLVGSGLVGAGFFGRKRGKGLLRTA